MGARIWGVLEGLQEFEDEHQSGIFEAEESVESADKENSTSMSLTGMKR